MNGVTNEMLLHQLVELKADLTARIDRLETKLDTGNEKHRALERRVDRFLAYASGASFVIALMVEFVFKLRNV